jgi:hypothetical protein
MNGVPDSGLLMNGVPFGSTDEGLPTKRYQPELLPTYCPRGSAAVWMYGGRRIAGRNAGRGLFVSAPPTYFVWHYSFSTPHSHY